MATSPLLKSFIKCISIITGVLSILLPERCTGISKIPPYPQNPYIIKMEIPIPKDSAGGLIVADIDKDGRMDYLVTLKGYIACYNWSGEKMWTKQADIQVSTSSESEGLPGHHGPGIQAGDIDEDGKVEVLYLTQDGYLNVLNGSDGNLEWRANPGIPEGAEKWEHLALVNLRGKGDRDIVLQATNKDGYRMGRFVYAFSLDALKDGNFEPLWKTNDFLACAHNGCRVADLNGDGKDEIISGCIIAPDGKELYRIPDLDGHLDSVFMGDVCPELPGIEVVTLEEGANRVFLFNTNSKIWSNDYLKQEPQNAAVGNFDLNRNGLEIWCRSRYDTNQKPWVFDSEGNVIAHYELSEKAPEDWTEKGIEVIYPIYWEGSDRQLICAKERHESGDVAVIDPITGEFIVRFPEKADRIYVADVAGDWREEIVVLAGNELHIYQNENPNPNPKKERLWKSQVYRRMKMVHNYYSP
ncbi:MAG: FG-GAP-like repeat-containing protein [Candidatus Hydrogenedentes bacterium]|nr:FG-GAP-like repeat-containing protein [Candidatus Hydrogenedentota bacterium]